MPKFQFHEVGLPEDKSVKETGSGAHPAMGVAEKFAITCAETEERFKKAETRTKRKWSPDFLNVKWKEKLFA